MEAVGLLAGGIAHDFNNILAVVLMQAELAGTTPDVPPETLEGLQQIRAAAERAANLTRQLLLFGRRQLMRAQDVDLNELVQHLGSMLRRIIGEDVSLKLDLHDGPLAVRADPGMIDQVLLNLSVNARDAMPEGGDLLIATAAVELRADDRERPPECPPGRYVRLSVADRGTGIPAEILARIFEPFFTTKPAGKGTGLGLATVFGIVRQHQGSIVVHNRPVGGAEFQIFLPESAGTVSHVVGTEVKRSAEGGTETFLLAEDEPLVRSLAERVLSRRGYRVMVAGTGREALDLARETDVAIALLVTDLVMPGGMNGQELARLLGAERAGLRVLFTSGYSADLAGQELTLRPGEQFLGKPFTPNQLLSAVRQTLDAVV
jgi:CheY-like chemotaxis protein